MFLDSWEAREGIRDEVAASNAKDKKAQKKKTLDTKKRRSRHSRMSVIARNHSMMDSFRSDDSWPGTNKFHNADIGRLPPPDRPWPILRYFNQRETYQDQALLFCRFCCSGKQATCGFL